jgi:hypothetical protein
MKTTVEWFVIELRKLIKESELSDMRPSEFDAKEVMLIEQAKEMEEQEKVEFAFRAYSEMLTSGKSFVDIVDNMRTFK